MQKLVTYAPQSFLPRKPVKALGAAIPEGDRAVPFPDMRGLVGLVYQRGVVPKRLVGGLSPFASRVQRTSQQSDTETETSANEEKETH
ncbi:MAG TPA: hypothetical protein VK724_19555 [Bryobacteraceae bacterium]|jgi:hypothetical protein|nr:hypothetical protein [Bryobacteraceae bacterium]